MSRSTVREGEGEGGGGGNMAKNLGASSNKEHNTKESLAMQV